MLDVTNDKEREQIARLVLSRLPGAEMLTAESVLVIFRESSAPTARWCGKAALRTEIEGLLHVGADSRLRAEHSRAVATDILAKLAKHTSLVPLLFLVPRGGRILLDLWPPSEILAARGLS